MADDLFTITRDWLHRFSTPGGGWTAEQLHLLKVWWPPRKGWLSASVGKQIPITVKDHFERLWAERQEFRRCNRTRGACNAAFVAEGEHTHAEMWALARQHYPKIVARLKAAPRESCT